MEVSPAPQEPSLILDSPSHLDPLPQLTATLVPTLSLDPAHRTKDQAPLIPDQAQLSPVPAHHSPVQEPQMDIHHQANPKDQLSVKVPRAVLRAVNHREATHLHLDHPELDHRYHLDQATLSTRANLQANFHKADRDLTNISHNRSHPVLLTTKMVRVDIPREDPADQAHPPAPNTQDRNQLVNIPREDRAQLLTTQPHRDLPQIILRADQESSEAIAHKEVKPHPASVSREDNLHLVSPHREDKTQPVSDIKEMMVLMMEITLLFLGNLAVTTQFTPKFLKRLSLAMPSSTLDIMPMLKLSAKYSTFALTTRPTTSCALMEPSSPRKYLFAFGGTSSIATLPLASSV